LTSKNAREIVFSHPNFFEIANRVNTTMKYAQGKRTAIEVNSTHPIVKLRRETVGIGRDDRTGLQHLAHWRLRDFPQPGECK
jgi:hypothetical protein